MNTFTKTISLPVLAVLVAGYLSIVPIRGFAQTATSDSEDVNNLLSEVKTEAHALETDTDHMTMYAGMGLTYESHALKINEIKDHVNNAGKLLSELEAARDTASPWQQKAIDEIRPLLQELADNTTAAMEHLKDNPHEVHRVLPTYDSYMKENLEVARELRALISDYVNYGKHKANLERLAETLAVPNQ